MKEQGLQAPDVVWKPRKASHMGFNDLTVKW